MSAPRFIPALAGDRSWLAHQPPLRPDLALRQWSALRDLVDAHIAPVVEIEAQPWAPAMTFSRDLGVAAHDRLVPLMPMRSWGPFEAPLAHRQLQHLGIDMATPTRPLRFDGGNVLADNHGRLLIGVTTSELDDEFIAVVRFLESATGRPAFRVPLAGDRFPHVDMALCDLNGTGWLVYPQALPGFDLADPAWAKLFLGLPVIIVDSADGELLACNLVVGDDVAIGPQISHELRRKIQTHGFRYLPTPLSELRKAGGGAHCLTLELPP